MNPKNLAIINANFKKRYSGVPTEQRRTIMQAYNLGTTIKDIAANLNISYYRARKVILFYQKSKKETIHRRRVLNDEQVRKLWQWMEENCHFKSTELMEKVEVVFGLKVSLSTIDRYLQPFHYNIRVLHDFPNTNSLQFNVKESYLMNESLKICDKEKIIFLDAITIQISTRSKTNQIEECYGRNVKRLQSKYFTLFCAFGQNALLHHFCQSQDYYNPISPKDFIESLLTRLHLWGSFSAFLVTPKSVFQNDQFVEKSISKSQHLLMSVPFIDSFQNPMGKLLDEWKTIIKKSEPNSETDLYRKAEMAFYSISPKEGKYFFGNIDKYIPCVLD